jgi:hypothetical protein
MMKRFLFLACLSLALTSLLAALQDSRSTAVHAATILLHCDGTHSATYSPGLTNTSQSTNVTIHDDFAPCKAPGDTTLTDGNAQASVTVVTNCQISLTTTVTHPTYHWNNGLLSVVTFASNQIVRLADGSTQITSTGTVDSGFGNGSTAIRVTVMPQPDVMACKSPDGVPSLSGPATLEFTL